MYIVITAGLLAILLSYLESKGSIKNGMRAGFVLLTILAVIHYDYGNDYMGYYALYNSIVRLPFNFKEIMLGSYYHEPGWALICYLFSHIGGFFVMVGVLNVFQNIVFYRFIKNNVSIEWRPMAVFVYVCSTSLYLMNFSMMRQGFAAAVFLSLWPLIKQRKFFPVVVILYLTSLVHSSAQFLIPLAFWNYIPFNKGKWIAGILGIVFLIIWTSSDTISNILDKLMTIEAFEGYVDTYGEASSGARLGLGFILHTIPFFVALYYLSTNNNAIEDSNALCTMGIIGILLVPFGLIIPMLGRFSTYFSVYSIAAIPICYSGIKREVPKYILIGLFVLITFYDYIIFFNNPTWVDHFRTFHTIFSVI